MEASEPGRVDIDAPIPSRDPIERLQTRIQEAWKLGNLEIWRLGGLLGEALGHLRKHPGIERGLEIQEAWKLGNLEVWRLGNLEVWRLGHLGGADDLRNHPRSL